MSIWITGDCHAYVERFSKECFPEQSCMTKDDVVIICGDFGLIWNKDKESSSEKYWLDWLNDKPFTTVFVCGNHENFDRLYEYPVEEWHGGKVHKIRDSVFHLMRGEVFEICGKKIFAFGGASSHDIQDGILEMDPKGKWKKKAKALSKRNGFFRVNHLSWWERELPTDEEMNNGIINLAKHNNEVDFVVSHCLPSSVQAVMSYGAYKNDILTTYFHNLISNGLKFTKWYSGHYHFNGSIMGKFHVFYDCICQIA